MNQNTFPLWRCLGLLVLGFVLPSSLFAQEPTYHPWRWEIGLRTTNFNEYFQLSDGYFRLHDRKGRGVEVFLLDRRPNRTFSRLAIGICTQSSDKIDWSQSLIAQPQYSEQNFRAFAASFEAGYGVELPMISRKFLDRFRVRTGLSLSIQAMKSLSYRLFQSNADTYAYSHIDLGGGSLWRGKVFLQTEFRIVKGIFAGLEWGFGPSLSVGYMRERNQSLVAGQQGYNFEESNSELRRTAFRFSNPIGLPSLSLGFSL